MLKVELLVDLGGCVLLFDTFESELEKSQKTTDSIFFKIRTFLCLNISLRRGISLIFSSCNVFNVLK